MRSVLIGAVQFTHSCLDHLIRQGMPPLAVVTHSNPALNGDFASLGEICSAAGIPLHYMDDINSKAAVALLKELMPEVIFCFGWPRIVKAEVLAIARLGVIGYHPTLLPQNRGRHPIIWALALGLSETGSTFFCMDAGIDSGDILSQRSVPIGPDDTAASLYARITEVALLQLEEFLPKLTANSIRRVPQDARLATYWRKRTPIDGRIDWRMPTRGIHNLVRALSRPYPGATVFRCGKDQIIWKTDVETTVSHRIEPGKVIDVQNSSVVVKTGDGSIALTDHELDPLPTVGIYL